MQYLISLLPLILASMFLGWTIGLVTEKRFTIFAIRQIRRYRNWKATRGVK